MKRTCEWCGTSITTARADARYCSSKHRIYAHRSNPLPAGMTSRQRWIRRTANKVPLTIHGTAASSTNPNTWATYTQATQSIAGIGLGYVLGDGIGCIDLDHCIINGQPTEPASTFLSQYGDNYIEISPSGDGLHIFGTAPEAPGTKRNIDGLSIERYSVGRYITVTRNIYQRGQLAAL